ncbi:MAG: TolC family outer membrane protein [Acidiferrobacterales bacterium]
MPGHIKLIPPFRLIDAFRSVCRIRLFFPLTILLFPASAYALDLIEALSLAKKNDPVYLAAAANYQADRQLLGQARADLLPNVSATGNRAQNDKTVDGSPQNFGSSGYTLSLRQPLINWARFEEFRQAKAEVRKAEADYSAARQELIKRLTTLYFDVLSASDTLKLAQSEQEAISEQLELAKARLEVGLGTITEVHDANARYKLAIAQSVDAENLLQDKRQALNEVIGSSPPKLKALKKIIPLLLPDPPNAKDWTDKAQQQNLSLLAATAETEIARRELSVKRAGHLPTLDVVGSHTVSDTVVTFGTKSRQQTTNNSVRLELTVPIFSGGKTYALSKEAKYRHQAAIQNMEAVRRNVFRSTRNAFLGIKGDVSRVKALDQAVVAGESALEAKKSGFEAGISSNIDVLNAQRDLFLSKRDYAQSRYSYLLNLLKLKEAAGILSIKDLEKINGWLE